MTTTHTTNNGFGRSANRFHRSNLVGASGLIIARYTTDRKLLAAVGGVGRFRKPGEYGTDEVLSVQPEKLANHSMRVLVGEGDERHTVVVPFTPEKVTLTGDDNKGRFSVQVDDYPLYTQTFEAMSPGGSWQKLYFGRKQDRNMFECRSQPIFQATWNLDEATPEIPMGGILEFAPEAGDIANSMPTAWNLLRTLAFCFGGGIDCSACFPQVMRDIEAPELDVMSVAERQRRDSEVARRAGAINPRKLMDVMQPNEQAAFAAALARMSARKSMGRI